MAELADSPADLASCLRAQCERIHIDAGGRKLGIVGVPADQMIANSGRRDACNENGRDGKRESARVSQPQA